MTFEEKIAEQIKVNATLTKAVAERDAHIKNLENSTSWRLTRPLRFLAYQIKRIKRLTQLFMPSIKHSGGWKLAASKAIRLFKNEGINGIKRGFRIVANSQSVFLVNGIPEVYLNTVNQRLCETLAPRVLIIAEMSIPQCKKYRVQQKLDMFTLLGIDSSALSWSDTSACIQALQTHTVVIFYRVPAFQNVISIINEAKRLCLPTIWEVDDFIFEKQVLAGSKTLAALDAIVFDQLMEGADLYRRAMLLCDRGIASTAGLAHAMKKAGLAQVDVVENALDHQTMEVAETICNHKLTHSNDIIRIVYGSGTNTHNIDFQEAASALISMLGKFPRVRFRIIGALDLPESFNRYQDQLERLPMCSYEEYLVSLAECDISIAPLENYIFNESKSNIKYLEASIVGIPSVCSPRAAFAEVIVNDENGYLCETEADWVHALTRLVNDPVKRVGMGKSAYAFVLRHYSPANIAQLQLAPLFKPKVGKTTPLRILSVNCYYSPRSFGGATIVAEEVNKCIGARNDFDVHVFTVLPAEVATAYSVRRYESDGINIYGIGLPEHLDERSRFENPAIVDAFANVLTVVKPNVVHFHSIQGIGVAAVDLCVQRGIKYVITLHDAWWLCGRQFMINRQGKYCNQDKIDLNTCAKCVADSSLNNARSQRLASALKNAAALLAPSQFFADFHIANGWHNVQVNKNGILKPPGSPRFRQSGGLRFGYVGGNTEIKGFHLVKKVFSDLAGYETQLILVDNAVILGLTTYHEPDLVGFGDVKIVPAYTQKTIEDFFSSIDVLLFPTQVKESFGLTIREALARNVWVIATNAGGIIEDVVEGRNGCIIPLADTGELLKKAVIDTLQYFQKIKVGDEVSLGTTGITFFEDQAAELSEILKKCTIY